MQVCKRDGRLVNFDKMKIVEAIKQAMSRTEKGIDLELANKIADNIEKHYNTTLTVEEISDKVENMLMSSSRKDVAKEYILYREKRHQERLKRTKLIKNVTKTLRAEEILNSNANVDEKSFAGRKNEATSIIQKEIALNFAISKDIMKAHKEGLIYLHDLDSYYVGMHNCLFIDFKNLLKNGFVTRSGDVREPKRFSTACFLIVNIFQSQSLCQFGGVANMHLDFDLAPFVKKSFIYHFKKGLKYIGNFSDEDINRIDENIIFIDNDYIKNKYEKIYNYAIDMLEEEGKQACESLYHNLNTLQSRAGDQLPFTSINLGRDTSTEGRLVNKWIFNASLNGIGKFHTTPIFPISIFQYKKGVNAKPGDKNYDIKKLAIKSLTNRLYPNFINGDWSGNIEDINNPDTYNASMGCVDEEEVVIYKIENDLYIESFLSMWDRMSKLFEIKNQNKDDCYYIDLEDITIFDSNKNDFVKCYRIIKNKDKNDWVRLKFSNGRTLIATKDHPLLVIDKGRTFVSDLQIGDKIEIAKLPLIKNFNEDKSIDIDKAWLLGLIIRDGCYDKKLSVSLSFEDENDIVDNYVNLMKKVYNVDTKIIRQQRGKKGNYTDIVITGNNLKNVYSQFEILFKGKQKKYREIPNEIFRSSREVKLSFLAGMIDGDGYISNKVNKSIVQLGSTNKKLSLQTMLLIESLGIPAKVYLNHYNKKDKSKIRYSVEFPCIKELLDYIISSKKKNKFIKEQEFIFNYDCKLLSIEELQTNNKYSYDVTTESDFFDVSGIISYNCRTLIGCDVNGLGYSKVGRGNNAPHTIILPKIALDNRNNIEGFWKDFEDTLLLTEKSLLERYEIQKSQSPKSAQFMYDNGTINNAEKCKDNVEESLKHNTLAIGYIGIAEMCQALFGKDHSDDENVLDFALSVVRRINEFAKECTQRNSLNFSCYATPAESLCKTAMEKLKEVYGVIPNVTDREFLTNSHHIPVWKKVSIMKKLEIESKFCKYPTGGCITYIELDSAVSKNEEAIEKIIDYAFDKLDIPYLAINFPIDTCMNDGYQGEINDKCPKCGEDNILRLRRVTGYTSVDYRNFNTGKQAEVLARVKHNLDDELIK